MINAQIIKEQLPPYYGRKQLLEVHQSTDDIVREILHAHGKNAKYYDKIAPQFWHSNPENTCRNLFTFLKTTVKYKVEPEHFQSVKTPSAIMAEGLTHGGDCKHYSSFIVGVCDALRRAGYPIKSYYRFAAYNNNKRPGHVFAIVENVNPEIGSIKDTYWVDPVLNGFNDRYPVPDFFIDKIPKGMSSVGKLYSISGVERAELGNGASEYRQVSGLSYYDHLYGKMSGDEIGKNGEFWKKIKKIQPGMLFKKMAASAPRNAFLGLLKLNAFKLALHLNHVMKHPEGARKLNSFWEKIGGNPNKLHTAVGQGVKFYNKLHHIKPKKSAHYKNDTGIYINKSSGSHRGHKGQLVKLNGFSDTATVCGNGDLSSLQMVSGIDGRMLVSGISYNQIISGFEDYVGWVNEPHLYDIEDWKIAGYDNEDMRMSNSIGFAPAAIPAMLAAAAPIIAAIKPILKQFGIGKEEEEEDGKKKTVIAPEVEDAEKATKKADQDLAETHNEKSDSGKEDADGFVEHDKKSGLKTRARINSKGEQAVEVKVNEDENEEKSEPLTQSKLPAKTDSIDSEAKPTGLAAINIKDFIIDHKWWVIGGTAAVILIPVAIKMFSRHGKKKK